MDNHLQARIYVLEKALRAIAELPFVTEESAWTWSDISQVQTKIARVALEDNLIDEAAQQGVEPTRESAGALPAISNQSDDELPF